jgi:hypothetical protein
LFSKSLVFDPQTRNIEDGTEQMRGARERQTRAVPLALSLSRIQLRFLLFAYQATRLLIPEDNNLGEVPNFYSTKNFVVLLTGSVYIFNALS